MRRHEQEIHDGAEIEAVLNEALVCRIGMIDGDKPYIVPVNYGFEGDRIYFHCAKVGKKIDILAKNGNVCFEVETGVEMVEAEAACKWTVKYRSVIGFGKAVVVEDAEEKILAFKTIMRHYSGRDDFEFPDPIVGIAAIVRIDIDSMTGKRSREA